MSLPTYRVFRPSSHTVSVRLPSPDPSLPMGGKLIGYVMPLHDQWQLSWRADGIRGSAIARSLPEGSRILFERLGIVMPYRVALRPLNGEPTLHTWTDHGRPMTAIQASLLLLDIRHKRPELCVPHAPAYLRVEPIGAAA